MKKKDILVAVGVLFLLYVVLTWIIPGGSFSGATLTTDTTTPLGLADIIMYPIAVFFSTNFIGICFSVFGAIILLIGGLYGVMNKASVYPQLVDKTVKKFEKHKRIFILISVLLFAILSSLTTLSWPLLVLVPFFVTVICLLGYDKVTAFMATVGAMLVGNLATVLGYQNESVNYFFILFGNDTLDYMVMKIVLFIVCLGILLLFLLLKKPNKAKKRVSKTAPKKGRGKKEETKEVVEEKKESYLLYHPSSKKVKKTWPVIVLVLLLVLINLIGMYNWTGAFNFKFFQDIYNNIINFKINKHAIFANILGTGNSLFKYQIGAWGNYNLLITLIITIIIIAKGYKLSFKDAFDGFISGVKEMLPTALVVVLVNIIYYAIISSFAAGNSLFFSSAAGFILGKTAGLNVINVLRLMGTTVVGSTMFQELQYVAMILQQPLSTIFSGKTAFMQVTMSSVFGFMMMVIPTSSVLVAGLGLSDLTWKDYIKGAFKILLALLLVIVLLNIVFIFSPIK